MITTLATGSAGAAESTTCKPTVRIFTMQADGDLWVYEHSDPVNGGFSWAGAKQVGWGWGGKTFAGADGRLYNITDSGELRRLRYNNGGWDTMPGGGQYETIGWGWQRYLTERNKITADADGSIYTLEGDQLRWWLYDEPGRRWAYGSGQVVDTGWSRFNSITGGAPGTLQARDSANALHRFRFQRSTDRALVYDGVDPSNDWRSSGQILTPGGDVYYAVRPDTGQLVWNRQTESDLNWAGEKVVGYGWGTDHDVTATTTDCSADLPMPNYRSVAGSAGEIASVALPATGGTHILGVNAMTGAFKDQYSAESGWATAWVDGQYVGVSDGVADDEVGSATVASVFAPTGDVLLHTVYKDQWWAPVSIKGGMETKPSISQRSDGTLAVYATSGRKLFVREQIPGGWRPWRQFGTAEYPAELTLITDPANSSIIVAQTTDGTYEVFKHSQGGQPTRIGWLPSGATGKVVLSGDGGTGLIAFARKDNTLMFVRGNENGFGSSWTPVADAAGKQITGEQFGAHVLSNGSTVIAATGEAGLLVSVSTSPGVFQPWQTIAAPDSATNAGIRVFPTRSGDVAVVTGFTAGSRKLYSASVPADPATSLQFTGGSIN
ncbi:hypothetical protein Lesp02_62980 [Lentzea sp. NBRC 105346]|nr:hypothetical protein Lesp02_62980 [Lentzea sp. NBRC 105346]